VRARPARREVAEHERSDRRSRPAGLNVSLGPVVDSPSINPSCRHGPRECPKRRKRMEFSSSETDARIVGQTRADEVSSGPHTFPPRRSSVGSGQAPRVGSRPQRSPRNSPPGPYHAPPGGQKCVLLVAIRTVAPAPCGPISVACVAGGEPKAPGLAHDAASAASRRMQRFAIASCRPAPFPRQERSGTRGSRARPLSHNLI
jgi:hypothetical protein